MNRDECETEEWWNAASSLALLVPSYQARVRNCPRSAFVIGLTAIASFLRHFPRHYLSPVVLDVFRGFDFTAIGVLVVVVHLELSSAEYPLSRGFAASLAYAVASNALFFTQPNDFPWSIAPYYYAAPVLFVLCAATTTCGRHRFSVRHWPVLAVLVPVAVCLRLMEQPGMLPYIHLHDSGTTCILEHALWHLVAASILYVLFDPGPRPGPRPGSGPGGARAPSSARVFAFDPLYTAERPCARAPPCRACAPRLSAWA